MLYEVITAVIEIGQDYLLIVSSFYLLLSIMFTLTGFLRGAGATLIPMLTTIASLRITSYNVCYTKLLRLPSAPQGQAPDLTYAAENSVHAVVHVKVISKENVTTYSNPFYDWFYRITSYNVCYTKLLRRRIS